MVIAGLDLSLTSTGTALVSPGSAVVSRISPGSRRSYERLDFLWRKCWEAASMADLVVVEGPSYGSPQGQHQLGGLWWLVTYALWRGGKPLVAVPPAVRCKYATGKGNAPKDQVLAAVIRRYHDVDVSGNDEADALVLAAMAADHLGFALEPVPETHRVALASVEWPQMGEAA